MFHNLALLTPDMQACPVSVATLVVANVYLLVCQFVAVCVLCEGRLLADNARSYTVVLTSLVMSNNIGVAE